MKAFDGKALRERGFSLVELMIVVGIIGVLATLAMPRFQQFQAKARMGEAKNMLNHIYALEEAYYLDRDTYIVFGALYGSAKAAGTCVAPAGATAIGFTIAPCNAQLPRYAYNITVATTTAMTAVATTGATTNNQVCPGFAAHTFNINQLRSLSGTSSAGVVGAPTGC